MATLLSRSQSGLPKQLRNFRPPGARAYLGVVSNNLCTSKIGDNSYGRTIKRLKLAMWMCATARFFPSPFLGSNLSMAEMPRNRSYRDRPSEVVSKGPPLNIADVHVEWDADLSIRGRLRDGGTFLNDTKEKVEDIPTCIKNAEILLPLLNRMSGLEKRPVPAVEDLREEICKALTLSKRSSQEDAGMVVDTASHIKKLCGFVKMKCRRNEPSSAT